jgi:adenylyltransferase/sulfurtransferase
MANDLQADHGDGATSGAGSQRAGRPTVASTRRTARRSSTCREKEEFRDGHLERSHLLPRGFLEMRVEETLPDKQTPDHRVLCGRHPLAHRGPHAEGDGLHERRLHDRRLQRLEERGHGLSSKITRLGRAAESATAVHFCSLPEVARRDRRKLLAAKVLLLGLPAWLGVTDRAVLAGGRSIGTLGDPSITTVVDLSNLQRQNPHTNTTASA